MKNFSVYLFFDGDARKAMEFYQKCFGGELSLMTYGEGPPPYPKGKKNKIMHGTLTIGPTLLMASDFIKGKTSYKKGNNFSISLECENVESIERLFALLKKGGKVDMPLEETFWAIRFGMVNDKYGIKWMLSIHKPEKTLP